VILGDHDEEYIKAKILREKPHGLSSYRLVPNELLGFGTLLFAGDSGVYFSQRHGDAKLKILRSTLTRTRDHDFSKLK
jgi:hypothetical protein